MRTQPIGTLILRTRFETAPILSDVDSDIFPLRAPTALARSYMYSVVIDPIHIIEDDAFLRCEVQMFATRRGWWTQSAFTWRGNSSKASSDTPTIGRPNRYKENEEFRIRVTTSKRLRYRLKVDNA